MTQQRVPGSDAAPGAAIRFTATVMRLQSLSSDVIGVVLAPALQPRFQYRPGQYLSVLLGDGERRSFSMANDCQGGGPVELHVRRRVGGRFSDSVLRQLRVGDRLELEGPFGQMKWQEGRGPAILMATGTGLAPLKALLEHALAAGGRRPIRLYWGSRALPDLYLRAHFQLLARENSRFRFIPVLSRPHVDWAGRRGYVQDAVAADLSDLHEADVYACGSGVMIEAARTRLASLAGFSEERFSSDAFEPQAPIVRVASAAALRLVVDVDGTSRAVRTSTGSTLLVALRNAGVPLLSICGGKASCGTCKVTIAAGWRDRVPMPERTEKRLLANLDDAGPGDRLACQIHLTPQSDGLSISLASRSWGSALPYSFDQLEKADD